MKKIVFLYALIASFSFVLSDNLSVKNDKSLDVINENNNLNVTIENSPVPVVNDKNTPNVNDNIPVNSDDVVVIDKNAIPDTSKTTTTTTTTTSTTTTTTKAPETTTSTTTTTTTTPKPTTTTGAPNTTTTSTTVAPTPKPTPFPKPSIGFWNSSCIMIQMAGQLNITYETKDSKNATVLYNIPKEAKIHDSDCNNNVNSQNIDIIWGTSDNINSLSLIFLKNGTNFYLYTMKVEIQILENNFPNAKDINQTMSLMHFGDSFKTPIKMSYHCTRMQSLNLTKSFNDTITVAKIEISNMQIEAFRTDGHSKFSSAKDCDATDTPDIVPIAVGIALIVLILVVLLSYLVARRRSTARGYMSF